LTTTEKEGNLARSRVAPSARVEPEPVPRPKLPIAVAALVVRWWRALVEPMAGTAGPATAAIGRSSPWTSPPPSLAELWQYTEDGEWVPGERAPVLEFLGRVYGFLLVLPVHAVAYGLLWMLARPTRLFIALSLIIALWITVKIGGG